LHVDSSGDLRQHFETVFQKNTNRIAALKQAQGGEAQRRPARVSEDMRTRQ
jgi:hypothetical protein